MPRINKLKFLPRENSNIQQQLDCQNESQISSSNFQPTVTPEYPTLYLNDGQTPAQMFQF